MVGAMWPLPSGASGGLMGLELAAGNALAVQPMHSVASALGTTAQLDLSRFAMLLIDSGAFCNACPPIFAPRAPSLLYSSRDKEGMGKAMAANGKAVARVGRKVVRMELSDGSAAQLSF